MGRDSGRGKAGGRGRGGGKMFIANEDEMRLRETAFREQKAVQQARRAEEGEGGGGGGDDDEDDEGEGEGEDSVFAFDRKKPAAAAGGSSSSAAGGLKAGGGGEDEDGGGKPRSGGLLGGIERVNPNLAKKPQERQIKVKDLKDALPVVGDPETAGMNRKEREAVEALRKKEEYQRRHMAGETQEAKKELLRLAEVRARREAMAAERAKAGRAPGWTKNGIDEESGSSSEEEESSEDEDPDVARAKAQLRAVQAAADLKAAEVAAKKKAAAAAPAPAEVAKAAGGEPDKLKSMDIKKMNGDALKDALKERKLEIQGAKKDLMQRLLDYEAARA